MWNGTFNCQSADVLKAKLDSHCLLTKAIPRITKHCILYHYDTTNTYKLTQLNLQDVIMVYLLLISWHTQTTLASPLTLPASHLFCAGLLDIVAKDDEQVMHVMKWECHAICLLLRIPAQKLRWRAGHLFLCALSWRQYGVDMGTAVQQCLVCSEPKLGTKIKKRKKNMCMDHVVLWKLQSDIFNSTVSRNWATAR